MNCDCRELDSRPRRREAGTAGKVRGGMVLSSAMNYNEPARWKGWITSFLICLTAVTGGHSDDLGGGGVGHSLVCDIYCRAGEAGRGPRAPLSRLSATAATSIIADSPARLQQILACINCKLCCWSDSEY